MRQKEDKINLKLRIGEKDKKMTYEEFENKYLLNDPYWAIKEYATKKLRNRNWEEFELLLNYFKENKIIRIKLLWDELELICRELLISKKHGRPSERKKEEKRKEMQVEAQYIKSLGLVYNTIRRMNPSESILGIEDHIELIDLLKKYWDGIQKRMKANESSSYRKRGDKLSYHKRSGFILFDSIQNLQTSLLVALLHIHKVKNNNISDEMRAKVAELFVFWDYIKIKYDENIKDVIEKIRIRTKQYLNKVENIHCIWNSNEGLFYDYRSTKRMNNW